MDFHMKCSADAEVAIKSLQSENGIELYQVTVKYPEVCIPQPVTVALKFEI